VNHFLEGANQNNVLVSLDQITVFLEHLLFSIQNSGPRKLEEMLKIYTQEKGILDLSVVQAEFSPRNLSDRINQILQKEENHSFLIYFNQFRRN
jgi:hypothetical protein